MKLARQGSRSLILMLGRSLLRERGDGISIVDLQLEPNIVTQLLLPEPDPYRFPCISAQLQHAQECTFLFHCTLQLQTPIVFCVTNNQCNKQAHFLRLGTWSIYVIFAIKMQHFL